MPYTFTMQFFYRRHQAPIVGQLITKVYHIAAHTPEEISPGQIHRDFRPLQDPHYDTFNVYPEFIVNYQKKMNRLLDGEEAKGRATRMDPGRIGEVSDKLRQL
jgi:hypothetical protein